MFKKNILILFLTTILIIPLYSNNIISEADKLDKKGKYKECLDLLLKNFDKSDPDPEMIWRIGLMTFELSEKIEDKKEKIKMLDLGIEYTKPYLEINKGTSRTRADIIHFYAINYAMKMKVMGIFAGKESLKLVPEILGLMDKCLKIEPEYASAYFFKAKIYDEIPFFIGGDKFKMEINYLQAIEKALDDEKIILYIDAANSFYNRGWNSKKKKESAKKNNYKFDLEYLNKNDKDFATELLNSVKKLYKKRKNPAVRETEKYKDVIKLMKKHNK